VQLFKAYIEHTFGFHRCIRSLRIFFGFYHISRDFDIAGQTACRKKGSE